MNISTKTRQDAFKRVAVARLGCLAGQPTEEYLVQLRGSLYSWIAAVDALLANSNEANPGVDRSCL